MTKINVDSDLMTRLAGLGVSFEAYQQDRVAYVLAV